jgi:hypothetical protein
MLTVVVGFVLCRRDVLQRAVQPALVPPLDSHQGGQLDLLGGAPRPTEADQLSLVQRRIEIAWAQEASACR